MSGEGGGPGPGPGPGAAGSGDGSESPNAQLGARNLKLLQNRFNGGYMSHGELREERRRILADTNRGVASGE